MEHANASRPVVNIAGQTHAVVGAASGIGRSCAIRLAELGARVVCLDVDDTGAKATVSALESAQRGEPGMPEHFAVGVDVTSRSSVDEAFAEVHSRAGQLHGVVNCAGITGETNVATPQVDIDDFDRVYAVNLRGALLVSKAVLPRMASHEYGRLLHVASISGKEGNVGMLAYSSTKAGLIGLVKVLGKEYATSGVTVNALAPAVVRTPMVEAMPDEQVAYMTDKIPMRRTCDLEEVADAVAWIVSPASSFTTAFTFDLSGGRAVY